MAWRYDPNDYYDPEEMRRRQIFQPTQEDAMPGAAQAMSEESEPGETEPDQDPDDATNVRTALTPSGPTDAQKQYRATLQQMPDRSQYQPSKLRRFGAALAGGLAGMRNPEMGVKVAQGIVEAPYNNAQQDWASKVNQGALQIGLDKDIAAQDIARQRASAYDLSAQARMKAANATEAWRRSQEQNQPWHARTMDEAVRFEQAKRGQPKLSDFDLYMKDPKRYEEFVRAKNAGKPVPMSVEDHLKIERMREAGKNARNAANIAARRSATGRPILASPADQQKAEDQAIQQLLRTNPEYAGSVDQPTTTQGGFLGFGGTKVPDPKGKTRIKGMDEVTQGKSGAEASLARDLHAKFLNEVARRKQAILGVQKNARANDTSEDEWDIKEDEE